MPLAIDWAFVKAEPDLKFNDLVWVLDPYERGNNGIVNSEGVKVFKKEGNRLPHMGTCWEVAWHLWKFMVPCSSLTIFHASAAGEKTQSDPVENCEKLKCVVMWVCLEQCPSLLSKCHDHLMCMGLLIGLWAAPLKSLGNRVAIGWQDLFHCRAHQYPVLCKTRGMQPLSNGVRWNLARFAWGGWEMCMPIGSEDMEIPL